MLSRTDSPNQSSFSKRSGLALLISSMFMISGCGPSSPRDLPGANGQLPQQVVDSSGNPVMMELAAVTQPNGSKVFDPTQSTIHILDCAVSLGTGICSNVYPYEVAGFESLGKRR